MPNKIPTPAMEPCCNRSEADQYVPPTGKARAFGNIQYAANSIERSNKIIQFYDRFPEAAKYLDDNNIYLQH